MKLRMLKGIGLTVLCLLLGARLVLADSDYDTARKLQQSGEILPLETILHKLAQTNPGKVLEVELETKHKKMVYEIEILDAQGKVWELKVDARSGEVIKREEED